MSPASASAPPSRADLRELVRIAQELTGFKTEAVSEDGLARFLTREHRDGRAVSDLLEGLRAGDRAAAERLTSQVMVAETFFFRHPDHFQLLLQEVLPPLLAREPNPRLWSAGCASGEEAYSLAACVLQVDRARARDVFVLGTDLSRSRLERARKGEYRNWSVRDAGPMLAPVVEEAGDRYRVREDVRALARFKQHNLLNLPPTPGAFDVIFCRNVLVYLDEEPARRVRAHLAHALRPGGYLFLGPLEGETPEPWLSPVAGRQDVVRRSLDALPDLRSSTPVPRPLTPMPRPLAPAPRPARAPRPPTPAPPPARALPAPPPTTPRRGPEVEAHCAALELVEHGDLGQARAALRDLRGRVPAYVPGVVDLALVNARLGHGQEAVRTMREALELLQPLEDQALVAGPETLPVEYYRAVAQVFLNQRRGHP
ncbi:MAG TPA: protein-glutamate O-methyltransferase CheR [Myxococcaceae bacterium]|nr:protein-glutamate O-methyltransferase CheR [Myxococcaceae bacterium]